jgi:alkanesulfonate monooxygenase SsuD/methylene tetrahydromethanopterin reductase-like flavin-dependent oxidoreductase (luciferase family)
MANHGTVFTSRHKLARERIEAMKTIWTEAQAEYHGEFVNFAPMMAWPKPVQKPYPPSSSAVPSPMARAGRSGTVTAGWRVPAANHMPTWENSCRNSPNGTEAGRDPASLPITIFRVEENLDGLRHNRDIGVARAVISVPAAKANEVLPRLDRWAALTTRLAG